MSSSAGSGGLPGRDRELGRAADVLEATAAGQPRVLLVGGDAGVGKTRLVGETLGRAAEAGFLVLVGHSLDIASAAPFSPVLEALAPVLFAETEPRGRVDPVARRVAGRLAGDAPGVEGSGLLEDLVQVTVEQAARRPVIFVLEDMHWADLSTQDFATALARTARASVLLVLTFRTEELTRHHPFRRTVGEIGHLATAVRIDVGPLGRDAVRAMVATRHGPDPDPVLVQSVLTRSEGNPLYVEELLSSADLSMPATLADLLLARVDALPSAPRQLVRTASADGTRIDPELLAHVVARPLEEVIADLRVALEANVVVRQGDGLAFRHGLLRQAVYDDLLAGERTRLHAAYAAAIGGDLGAVPSLARLGALAFHCYAACDQPAALVACVRAAEAATRYGSQDAVTHLERAVQLWPQVPDAEAVLEMPRAELLCRLAEAYWGAYWGAPADGKARARRLARQALQMVDLDADRRLASRIYATLAAATRGIGDGSEHRRAVAGALESARGLGPTPEFARALATASRSHFFDGDCRRARAEAAEAAAAAKGARRSFEQCTALGMQGLASWWLGLHDESHACLERSIEVAYAGGHLNRALQMEAEAAWNLAASGDLSSALTRAGSCRAKALAAGLPDVAVFAREQEVEILIRQGRLDAVDALLAELREEGMQPERWRWLAVESMLARGNTASAATQERETQSELAEFGIPFREYSYSQYMHLLLDAGEVARALELARRLVTDMLRSDSPLLHAAAARWSFQSLVEARSARLPEPDGLAVEARRALESATSGLTDQWRSSLYGGHALVAAALAATLGGRPAAALWREAARVESRLGDYHGLASRLGLATALLHEHERDEGRELLTDIWRTAREMGTRSIQERAAKVARRTQVTLPESSIDAGPLARLTAREREVLDLLTAGTTNRSIADKLFISQKTVSIHVSNILGKLQVANRGEAAALARQLRS
jgi:DNA-binding CsgD family transcriptional regulator